MSALKFIFHQITQNPLFNLITFKGISTAIQAIDCPKRINPEKYHTFAQNWLDDFHSSIVNWSWLSPTVHLLFVHGADILRVMPVSTYLLSG